MIPPTAQQPGSAMFVSPAQMDSRNAASMASILTCLSMEMHGVSGTLTDGDTNGFWPYGFLKWSPKGIVSKTIHDSWKVLCESGWWNGVPPFQETTANSSWFIGNIIRYSPVVMAVAFEKPWTHLRFIAGTNHPTGILHGDTEVDMWCWWQWNHGIQRAPRTQLQDGLLRNCWGYPPVIKHGLLENGP